MRAIRWFCLLALLALVPAALAPAQEKSNGKVAVSLAKYDRLGEIVRQLKGKVVIVDFWTTT
jgi:hypothetical protein